MQNKKQLGAAMKRTKELQKRAQLDLRQADIAQQLASERGKKEAFSSKKTSAKLKQSEQALLLAEEQVQRAKKSSMSAKAKMRRAQQNAKLGSKKLAKVMHLKKVGSRLLRASKLQSEDTMSNAEQLRIQMEVSKSKANQMEAAATLAQEKVQAEKLQLDKAQKVVKAGNQTQHAKGKFAALQSDEKHEKAIGKLITA